MGLNYGLEWTMTDTQIQTQTMTRTMNYDSKKSMRIKLNPKEIFLASFSFETFWGERESERET